MWQIFMIFLQVKIYRHFKKSNLQIGKGGIVHCSQGPHNSVFGLYTRFLGNVSLVISNVFQTRVTFFRKRWQIYKADNETCDSLEAITKMRELGTWDKSVLVITPNFLEYGEYKVTYTLTMQG